MMKGSEKAFRQQTGAMLLEALIAILIFSLGILAIVGLQAVSITQANDAMFRTHASLLANELIGQMWTTVDRTQADPLSAFRSSPAGAAYTAWLAKVQADLPGVSASTNSPNVAVTADDNGVLSVVTIDLFWKLPSEPANVPAHHYVVTTQIQ
jgi:type IV pilus assembly protein PilV